MTSSPTGSPPVPEGAATGTGSRFPSLQGNRNRVTGSRTGSRPTGLTTLHRGCLELWADLTSRLCDHGRDRATCPASWHEETA